MFTTPKLAKSFQKKKRKITSNLIRCPQLIYKFYNSKLSIYVTIVVMLRTMYTFKIRNHMYTFKIQRKKYDIPPSASSIKHTRQLKKIKYDSQVCILII